MGRMTRKKAAEVAEQLHVDESVVLELPDENIITAVKVATPEPNGSRLPLGELVPNSADSKSQSDDQSQELSKSTRGRKGVKKTGAKNRKDHLAASTASQPARADSEQQDLPNEFEPEPSPASEKAAEDLTKDFENCEYMAVELA